MAAPPSCQEEDSPLASPGVSPPVSPRNRISIGGNRTGPSLSGAVTQISSAPAAQRDSAWFSSTTPPPKPARSGKRKSVMSPEQAASIIQRRWRYYYCRKEYLDIKRKIGRRNKIVQEILASEASYLGGLKTLSKVFLQPLEASSVAEDYGELKNLFGGIKVIIGYNSILLNDLQQRVPTWNNHSKLGDAFLRMVQFLKAYTQYVNTYKQCIDAFEKLKLTKQYTEWESKLDKTECGGLQLGDYLIMPIQRLPRYNMLLEDLVKNTWRFHIDYDNLRQAHQKIKDIANFVNASQREAENQRKMSEILNTIQSVPVNFVEPWRRYIHDGLVTQPSTNKALHIYLFNDAILFARIKKDKKFFERWEDLLYVSASADDSSPTGFSLKEGRDSSSYTVATPAERTRWLEAFQDASVQRQELKKASDELIQKNISKKIAGSHDGLTPPITYREDNKEKPAKPQMRKTTSVGNLGSLAHLPHINLGHLTARRDNKDEEDSEPAASAEEASGPADDKKKKMRRASSIKNLLSIVNPNAPSSSLSPPANKLSIHGLLSPRAEKEKEKTEKERDKEKEEFYKPRSRTDAPKISLPQRGNLASALNNSNGEDSNLSTPTTPEPEKSSRGRGLTMGLTGLWGSSKKDKDKDKGVTQSPSMEELDKKEGSSPGTAAVRENHRRTGSNIEMKTSTKDGSSSDSLTPRELGRQDSKDSTKEKTKRKGFGFL